MRNKYRLLLNIHFYLMIALSIVSLITATVTDIKEIYIIAILALELGSILGITSLVIEDEIKKIKKRVEKLEETIYNKD